MTSFRRLIRFRARAPVAIAAELREELETHVALSAEELRRRGVPPDEALAQARARFGNFERTIARLTSSAREREAIMKRRELWTDFQRDVALSLRHLRRAPLWAGTIIVTLALGVGANTAIFSFADELLLRPLPVPEPERLVNLAARGPKFGTTSCSAAGHCDDVFSYPMYRDLERAKPPAFTGIAGHVLFGANVAVGNQTVSGTGALVSGSYFPVLGLRPALGRLLTRDDDDAIGDHFVAVLSYHFWETQLAQDPSVIGKIASVNGQPMTVIGVAPQGFDGTTIGVRPSVFVPITMRAIVQPGWRGFDDRRSYWMYVFARLQHGVSLGEAQGEINTVYQPIIRELEAPLQTGVTSEQLLQFRSKKLAVEDGRRGQSSLQTDARTPLMLMFVITTIVLLISCANIANLLLARMASRATEVAVRLSLGASRAQLFAQVLTESCVLALVGAVVSLAVAFLTITLITALLPTQTAGVLELQLRLTSVAFALGLSLICGLLFGIIPAARHTRPDLASALRAGSAKLAGTRGSAWLRSGLATSQVALSLILLITAALFLRSLVNVSHEDVGFQPDGLVAFTLSPGRNGYDRTRTLALSDELMERLRGLPGVKGVTAASVPILAGNDVGSEVAVQGFAAPSGADVYARRNDVGPRYFQVMGIPLLEGREFTAADALGSPRVAIVNRAFVQRFGLGAGAVGKRMGLGQDQTLDIQIVGVSADAKYTSVKEQVAPEFVLPYHQESAVSSLTFYVRASRSSNEVMTSIRSLVSRLDANLPVESLQAMRDVVRDNTAVDRMISTLSAVLAILATLLAALGLYAVLSYLIAERTREIGIRIALGADAARIMGMVLRVLGRMAAIGALIGVIGSVAIGQLARSLLFQLRPLDPVAGIAAVVLLGTVALTAGYLPARRATRVDPVEALRAD